MIKNYCDKCSSEIPIGRKEEREYTVTFTIDDNKPRGLFEPTGWAKKRMSLCPTCFIMMWNLVVGEPLEKSVETNTNV